MTLFDLSHPIRSSMPVYPGDPAVAIESALSITTDGVNVAQLHLGSHTGTHLDAPAHVFANGRTVDQLDLALLDGAAYVVQTTVTDPTTLTGRAVQLDNVDPLPKWLPNIVCVATGWDRYFYHPLREDHPFIDIELARTLWDRGARVLGVDTLSPDPTSKHCQNWPVHDFWLGNDGVVVENLRGLTRLADYVNMSILPLSLQGGDGSPVRAVARQT